MRRPIVAVIAPSGTWPENPGTGGSSTGAKDPFNWIRWDNRGLADVAVSLEGPIHAPGGVADPAKYWDRWPAADIGVRNIGKPAATELHLLNLSAVSQAVVLVELDTEPIVDIDSAGFGAVFKPSQVSVVGTAGAGAGTSVASDTLTSSTVGMNSVAENELFDDGTGNWERQRNNSQSTLLASAARTATASSANQTNFNARGMLIFLNISGAPNTAETLAPVVRYIDPVSGVSNALGLDTAIVGSAVQAGSFRTYMVYPGMSNAGIAPASSVAQSVINHAVPRVFFVQIQHSGASSWTYSVGMCFVV